MSDRFALHAAPDDALEAALRGLSTSVAFPDPTPPGIEDLAARARRRIVAAGVAPARGRGWPLRRSFVLAFAALLTLAVAATAVGLWLPGLRIAFGDLPSPAPTTAGPASGPPGSSLGLGSAVSLEEAEAISGLDLRLPADPSVGPPDVVYVGALRQVSLVWAPSAILPPTDNGGVGLLMTEYDGRLDVGYFEKLVDSDATVEEVSVGGARGYWISGPPHFFYFVDRSGQGLEDSHRVVGDTLVWTSGGITYRLESALGRDGAIRLAESLE